MHRLTVRFTIAAATFGLLLLPVVSSAIPVPAHAAGCEVLGDPRDRAECEARAVARETARAEVQRQLDGGAAPAAGFADGSRASSSQPNSSVSAADPARSADWQAAMDEADGIDPTALLEPRPLAAVGGVAWFLVVLRARRRARTRAHRA